ncbi:MAG: methyltransferase domain-containing protein [Patescibacteria group bacterium]
MSCRNYNELSPGLKGLTRLNLGCGDFPEADALNIDVRPEARCDLVLNLNNTDELGKLPQGKFEYISLFHVLEHLDDPFGMIRACVSLLKPGGILQIRVPHFSRGFTHSEHKHGFDVGLPHYFNPKLPSFFYGPALELVSLRLDWTIRPDIYRMVIPDWQVEIIRAINAILTPLANLSPGLCSRIWCYWVGGFEQIEYRFRKSEN